MVLLFSGKRCLVGRVGASPPPCSAWSPSPFRGGSLPRTTPKFLPGTGRGTGEAGGGVARWSGQYRRWCRLQGSNPRPPDYKSGALPTELSRHRRSHASGNAEGRDRDRFQRNSPDSVVGGQRIWHNGAGATPDFAGCPIRCAGRFALQVSRLGTAVSKPRPRVWWPIQPSARAPMSMAMPPSWRIRSQ